MRAAFFSAVRGVLPKGSMSLSPLFFSASQFVVTVKVSPSLSPFFRFLVFSQSPCADGDGTPTLYRSGPSATRSAFFCRSNPMIRAFLTNLVLTLSSAIFRSPREVTQSSPFSSRHVLVTQFSDDRRRWQGRPDGLGCPSLVK